MNLSCTIEIKRQLDRALGHLGHRRVLVAERRDSRQRGAGCHRHAAIGVLGLKTWHTQHAHIHDGCRGTLRLNTAFHELKLIGFGVGRADNQNSQTLFHGVVYPYTLELLTCTVRHRCSWFEQTLAHHALDPDRTHHGEQGQHDAGVLHYLLRHFGRW